MGMKLLEAAANRNPPNSECNWDKYNRIIGHTDRVRTDRMLT